MSLGILLRVCANYLVKIQARPCSEGLEQSFDLIIRDLPYRNIGLVYRFRPVVAANPPIAFELFHPHF
jgi:hypothetical protein